MTPTAPATTHLLYLHGFRSSPQSAKARVMAAWMAEHRPDVVWCCPQLPPSPAGALALISELTRDWPADTTSVVGSSLGGFYATVLAEARGCRALLLNPAVNPARDLTKHIGETTQWHSDEAFFFRPEFVDELRAMAPAAITRPERYGAVIAQGDEVLDWREMAARYVGSDLRIHEGGDHAISDFEPVHLPGCVAFLGLAGPIADAGS
ncbi:MAG: hypothetical protein RJA98_3679 [Pseudomonadota bacterium]